MCFKNGLANCVGDEVFVTLSRDLRTEVAFIFFAAFIVLGEMLDGAASFLFATCFLAVVCAIILVVVAGCVSEFDRSFRLG